MAMNVRSCCILGWISVYSLTAQTINDTKTLTQNHMEGYNKYVRPVANQSEAVHVKLLLTIFSVQEFDEVQETLSAVGMLGVFWHDASMVWNPADYNGVRKFRVSYKDVWVPDMILTNPAEEINTMGAEWQPVHYYSDGRAIWSAGNSLKTTCSVNMWHFPFDTQECDIIFYPWGYNQREVLITTLENGINFSFYTENGVWSVVGSSTRTKIVGDGSLVIFTIRIQRKPGFVVVNVLLPILFLSLINVLVFILPVESGERVSYCITVLLSIAVFMTIVSDTLPRNSEPVPIIAFILMMEMILSSLTTLVVILNIKIYYKTETAPVPRWLQNVVKLQCFRSKRKVNHPKQESHVHDATTVTTVPDLQEEETKCSKGNCAYANIMGNVDNDARITWRDVSAFLDRLAFWTLLSVTVFSFAFFIVITMFIGQ